MSCDARLQRECAGGRRDCAGVGSNYYGQTGNGAPTKTGCNCIPSPALVNGLSDAIQISGGGSHTLALRANGTVAAWGDNSYGQLGNGTTDESLTPVPVSGLANVVEVDAGYEHSLALLANGTVMTWGENYYGQLGVGGNGSDGRPESCNGRSCSKWPVQVPGLSGVVAIAAGGIFSLALQADGTVMAWGRDRYGQLGDGVGIESGCQCVDHAVQVPGVSGAMAISAGENWGMALLGNGTVTAWGQNSDGQLGNGSTIETPPACQCAGPGGVSGLSGPVRQIAAGGYHGVALLGNGAPQAWGYDLEGELGTGAPSTNDCACIPTAVSVVGLSGVQSIAAGEYHTLALLGDGSVRSWGYNDEGPSATGPKPTAAHRFRWLGWAARVKCPRAFSPRSP